MGRYSDSDDDRKRKKKSKRKSRSRSSSLDSRTSKSSKAKKSKKSKHKRKSRSRSRSADRYRSNKKARSASKERRRSRSRSKSKPKSYRIKSRSPSPYRARRRSRSPSPYRSKKRSRSRSPSPYKSRRRSRSRSPRRRSRSPRRRSRSRSRDRSRRDRSRSRDEIKREKSPICAFGRKEIKPEIKPEDPVPSIPGFENMSAAEQSEARLQLALKAAAAAGEKLKEQGVLPASLTTTYVEQQARSRAIEGIESDSFTPSAFKSSKEKKNVASIDSVHDSAIFGLGDLTIHATPSSELQAKDTESLMHPNLYISAEDKMQRWIKKLGDMRRRKLEGNIIF